MRYIILLFPTALAIWPSSTAQGGGCETPRVFILGVVKIGGKDQQIALHEYSRLVVFFFFTIG